MLGVDSELGTSVLRLWVAAGSAALLVAICVLVFAKSRTTTSSSLRSGGVVVAAILGAAFAWASFGRGAVQDHAADRRALEVRAAELATRALAPGSALACLDGTTGESVGAACEKAIFATPASVATAISYAAARFTLLSDMIAYTRRGGTDIDNALVPLRRSLEADPFGFLAHALALRDGCTGENCKALALLSDPSHVRANLGGATLDRYLDHYLTVWAQAPDGPVADATPALSSAMTQSGAPGQHKVLVNIDFPTAASIPPVSIMNPEPKGSVPPSAAAAAAGGSNAQAAAAPSSRRSRKQVASPPAQAATQSAPASSAAEESQVDPVWTPAPAAAAQSAPAPAAPAANLASGAGAPVQLNPFASAPDARANMTTRTQ